MSNLILPMHVAKAVQKKQKEKEEEKKNQQNYLNLQVGAY